MAGTFASGEIVQLRSGGPRMTVTTSKDGENGEVAYCAWFDEKKEAHEQAFLVSTLKRVSTGPKNINVLMRRPGP